MKRDLNLVPRSMEPSIFAKYGLNIGVGILVFLIVAAGALIIPRIIIDNKTKENTALTQKAAEYAQIDKQFNDASKGINQFASLKQAYGWFHAEGYDVLYIVNTLQKACPAGINVTSARFFTDRVELSGTTTSDDMVADFAVNIKKTDICDVIVINNVSQADVGNARVFDITVQYPIKKQATEHAEQQKKQAEQAGGSAK